MKPGGVLVYSTCTVLPEENGEQVRAFLEAHPEFSPYPMGELLPEGLRAEEADGMAQFFAHRHPDMEGFFIARMRKKGGR